jgi:hypothetical protein
LSLPALEHGSDFRAELLRFLNWKNGNKKATKEIALVAGG